MVALLSIPVSVQRSVCTRSDCFAYSPKCAHNCYALTEAPDPCNFYKPKAQHEREQRQMRMRLLKEWGIL